MFGQSKKGSSSFSRELLAPLGISHDQTLDE